MKAILIDSTNQMVSSVEISKDIQDYYKLLQCRCFTTAFSLPNGDTCFVDDEGLLSISEDTKFFKFKGAHQPFSGNGLIVGCDVSTGESQDVKTSVDEIAEKLEFKDLLQVQYDLMMM